ncbi:hypothetical protein IAU59_007012 [Kwoniella sp. CBS 9459]
MSADVETPITLPAFPRPTSLYLPDVTRSVPILDTSSYSPFPTFPGANHRARDPYGLNAYLLHPDDNLWHYVDPMPNPDALAASGQQHQRSSSMDEQSSPSQLSPMRSIKKQRSLSGLRPSPLSQPPVSGEKEDELDVVKPELLQRRRSSSLSSSPRLSLEQEVEIVATFKNETAKTPKTPKSGKKTLRRAFTKARKSVFGTNDTPPVPSMPALREPPALLAPSMSGSSSDSTTDPTTPMTSRSNSNYSSVSSASSTSSSEGVKTPAEGVSAEIAITGSKLADALQEAGEKKSKGKGWKWLGAKKGGRLAVKELNGSGSTTPLSDLSAASTPNSSTPDLLAGGIPKVTLTPSPAISTTPRSGSPVLAPSEQLGRQHTWATEQLRRVSMRKLSQLRSPSPHPLALSLRRQNSKLPDEVAFSIQSGQRVFPMSVNLHQRADGDLVPAQGGLWLNIAISRVMQKLEAGEQPDGVLKARPVPKKKSTIPRPRGVLDFINRPPYEERNIVFYPDNVFSPISMARPGYGVWDLDFSPYIFALSTIDDSGSSWPAIPRASMETPSDELAEVIKAFGDALVEDENVETLKSPAAFQEQGPDAALVTLTSASAISSTSTLSTSPALTPAQSPSKSRPLSSFRPAGRHSNASSGSASSASSSEESESEEEDDEPLAVVAKRRSQSFQSQPRPVGTIPVHPAAAASSSTSRPSATVVAPRSLSQPDKRALKRLSLPFEAESSRWKEMQQQHAMNEVARARERREANRVGEVEKKAVSEQIKAQQLAKRRSSMLDLRETFSQQPGASSSSKHKRNSSATALAVPLPRTTSMHMPAPAQAEDRRRRGSSHGFLQSSTKQQQHLSPARPEASRAKSGPPPVGEKRGRYHSFYEQRAASTSAPSFHSAHSNPNPKTHGHTHGFPQHGVSPYPHPHHVHPHVHAHAQILTQQGGMQVYPPTYQQQQQRGSMYGMGTSMGMPPTLGMAVHPYVPQQGIYGSPAGSKMVTRMA